MNLDLSSSASIVPPATQNATAAQGSSDTAPTNSVDDRRYTKFDRTATEAGTASLSFGDFVDMINPLQHIPVVSSIYRTLTGETINPVARVTGDILYGGMIGAASAVIGGIGAIANASLESTTGKDSAGLVLANILGSDSPDATAAKVADATPLSSTATSTAMPSLMAAPSTGVQSSPLSSSSAQPVFNGKAVTTQLLSNAGPIPSGAAAKALSNYGSNVPASKQPVPPAPGMISGDGIAAGISLAGVKITNKKPYGGVMGPPSGDVQSDMALAIAQGSPSMRMGHTIYTNQFTGSKSLAPGLSNVPTPVSTNASALNSVPDLASMTSITAGSTGMPSTELPVDLTQDMMLKAISQYKSTAVNGNSNSSYSVTN